MHVTKLFALAAVFAVFSGGSTGMPIEATQTNDLTAIFKTTKGDIRVTLFPEEAPLAVANLVNLAQRGLLRRAEVSPCHREFHDPGR